jgi:hypothetical protein
MIRFLLAALSLILSGCITSGFYLDDVNRNMQDIRTAISNLYGIQSVSDNERVIITPPLKADPNDPTSPKLMKARVYARVVLVNDRRPYRMHVQVYQERKVKGEWVELDIDERLSEEFAREIYRELINSRDKRNVIDDFRAF